MLVEKNTVYSPSSGSEVSPYLSRPRRLGAYLSGDGVDFAVRAPQASRVQLCIFTKKNDGSLEENRYELHEDHGTWSGHVAGAGLGTLYGYRVHGRWAPEIGLRHNPAKLLLDPYARAISHSPILDECLYGHNIADEEFNPSYPLEISQLDSAWAMALGVVISDGNATPDDTHPYLPWETTVIYEAHVKGLTALNPALPQELRGTYAGLAHPWTIAYLKSLGITAIELLPIHAHMHEPFLAAKNLSNYWGYNTLNYFAPEPSYATKAAQQAGPRAVVEEVKEMVKALHAAGIEVLLDVVYNHTCEGGINGPTVSFRGLDQTSYYLSDPHNPAEFMDMTGCGNTLDFRRQDVVKLALDSLRYWASEIGVDGFRFDLSVTLGRNGRHFDSHHPFFLGLYTDPILSQMKIINEPWDLGPNGWQTGRFLYSTADWNDRFRDTARTFWLSQARTMSLGHSGGDMRDLATRLAGSADLFDHGRTPGGRGLFASINFITAHDGFTMRDLVSFDSKHNEINGEANRDGTGDNKSWNHGCEGIGGESHDEEALTYLTHALARLDTDEESAASLLTFLKESLHGNVPHDIRTARRKTLRNLFATLFLSAGTPMMVAGDEFARTQLGNNNCYCQDNQLSWLNWNHAPWQEDLRATVSYLISLRQRYTALHPSRFYTEGGSDEAGVRDLAWLDAFGKPMPKHQWFDADSRLLQMMRSGRGKDADILVVINGSMEEEAITLAHGHGLSLWKIWDSTWERPRMTHHDVYRPGAHTRIHAMSVQIYATDLL